MDNSIIPTPDTIPVHWLWFQVLLTFTFILHLLFMNMILGGSLLTIWNLIRGKNIDSESKHLPTLIALTINLGVPPLLFVQVLFGNFFYTSSVMMAVYWILVIPILILAYYGAYIFSKKMETKPLLAKISLIISTVFALYIAFMFVNNSTLALQPNEWGRYLLHPEGKLLNIGDHTFLPRYLHFLVAAVAIASLLKAVWAKFFKKSMNEKEKQLAIKSNLKVFAWATIVQFVVGIWFWISFPTSIGKAFLGGDLTATLLMGIALISALLIIYFALKGKLVQALIQGLFQVIIMAIVREVSRSKYLIDLFKPSELVNVHQTSPLVVFLLTFVIGLLAIYFMYTLTLTSKSNKS
ncbi:MAG: hypothetical protein ACERKD_04860 [Prolixibacteraceae bacterium]